MYHTFSVLDFGAVPNSTALQTDKIQAAIDSCFENGGGTVVIPAGTYHTGCILLRSDITLRLLSGAVLCGSRDPLDYRIPFPDMPEDPPVKITRETVFTEKTASRWGNALIRALYAGNISVIGEPGSVIDGRDCFDEQGEENYRGPHAIAFYGCRNITLSGYTIQNSGNWAHNISYSENITCRDIRVIAGHDGIHISECRNIDIVDCEFYTGDDCVAGFANVNVTVTNCTLNSACSAMRFGGTNVLVRNCRFFGPGKYLFRGSLTPEEKRTCAPSTTGDDGHRHNMLSAFTYYADHKLHIAEQPCNIILTDCIFENADRFLHLNFNNEQWQRIRSLGNITFRNIRASGVKIPFNLYGDPKEKVSLTVENTSITNCPDFSGDALIHAANFDSITLKNVALSDIPLKTLVKRWTADDRIRFENVTCSLPDSEWVKDADEPFFAEGI